MRAAVQLFSSLAIPLLFTPAAGAQTRLTLPEELQRELTAGDEIRIIQSDGRRVSGRLIRLRDAEVDLDVIDTTVPVSSRTATIPLTAVRSLERPRDSLRNGTWIGAGIGAAFGAAMFIHATIVDRNEMDEWAGLYAGFAAASTGIGALVGLAVDASKSKPHIIFEPVSGARPTLDIRLGRSRVALAVSF
jgi:hypothetical protein